jgi:SAM-dependent methyltransferase
MKGRLEKALLPCRLDLRIYASHAAASLTNHRRVRPTQRSQTTMVAKITTHSGTLPPDWALERPKPLVRQVWDLVGAPLRMMLMPDHVSERYGLTSLRAERMAAVLPELRGRLLDVGAGDNVLVKLYRRHAVSLARNVPDAEASLGVDVVDWGSDCVIIESAGRLPFPDASFDTVSFIACINHIPERRAALAEAGRVLRPGGRVVLTMIGRLVGDVGHMIWWYSEDKHREVAEGELMGMDREEVETLLRDAGFSRIEVRGFVYGLNRLFIAEC